MYIDKKILYHCGSSFKDLGKKCFAITKIDDDIFIKELIDSLNNKEIYNFGDNMHVIKDITVYGKKENLDIIRKNMEE